MEDTKSQRLVKDLQFRELLPDVKVQTNLLKRWAVLVSRIVTKYMQYFGSLKKCTIHHIKHKHTQEMAHRSVVCCLGMEFLNPNIAGDMAQLMQHNQKKYVPTLGDSREPLICVPMHGDQLYEERSRNVKWSFRDGLDPLEQLHRLDTEFADWHAKYTLYKFEYKLFVDHSSAGEIGTSMASINRTGKTNAAKGVENHYNEYSEFHSRETEAHILASFMEHMGMKNLDDSPNGVTLPDSDAPAPTKGKWLLDVCEEHVKRFVFNAGEMTGLVEQTDQLQQEESGRWVCRAEDCDASYKLHSGRVRYSKIKTKHK
ncbi:uncharacterized protein LOC114531831 [Dendronephthya gigantea]|uniref:uncharacterized protein LOC114531831 n=1 Tax=Dendronephthya gigantea TaxID=151771 RepID=UPI001069AAFB|nr:uncharacterized protein LOC114531831 [Dendronephthya gigantea]